MRSSEKLHGVKALIRYRGLLMAAFRHVAADPQGVLTVDRSGLSAGLRSLHIRHVRTESREAPVGNPVHIVFFRADKTGIVEIVRVLHERMEPVRHLSGRRTDQKDS
jgi:toxin ParE1/3/4